MGVKVARTASARPAPEGWREWLVTLFPGAVSAPMATHHEEFWNHVWAIDYPSAPRPWLSIWSREGGKTTNVEIATLAMGVRRARRYALYICKTQEAADGHVSNIRDKLESEGIEAYYPLYAQPLLSTIGTTRSWKRNRLRTAGGFNIEAVGLDVKNIRGLKIGDDRPDLLIFDDIDDEDDTPQSLAKKIRKITTAILPAAARDRAAILGAQNLIHADGIFTRMVDGRAEFLTNRIVSGPHPALLGMEWEWRDDPETGTRQPYITKGRPTWAGQDLETCRRQIVRWGPTAFVREAQHEVRDRAEGLALNFDENEHYLDLTLPQIQALVKLGRPFAGIDFGAWRFAFVLRAADTAGRAIRIGEIFSQREEAAVRARRIHELCELVGIVRGEKLLYRFPIWGDAANPQDIIEMNAAWTRGWRDDKTGKPIVSPLRMIAVGMENKLRRAAVERINDKLGSRAILYVRSPVTGVTAKGEPLYIANSHWFLGYNAGSGGTMMKGVSRLIWELQHWSYPVPKEGKVDLKQDPDDMTADGADMIAADRYGLMSWYQPGKERDETEQSAFAPEMLEAERERVYKLKRSKPKKHRFREDY
jgi:hypothetical protein